VALGRGRLRKEGFVLSKQIEYALINFEDYLTFNTFHTSDLSRNVKKFLNEGNWGIVNIVDNIALLKRGYLSKLEFYSLIEPDLIQKSVAKPINAQISLIGYDIRLDHCYNNSVAHLSVDWKCNDKITYDGLIAISVSDKQGKVISERIQDICYHIYPTSDWKTGEIVMVNYWACLPSQENLEEYYINLTFLDDNRQVIGSDPLLKLTVNTPPKKIPKVRIGKNYFSAPRMRNTRKAIFQISYSIKDYYNNNSSPMK
jgi:hypothetical protein